MPFRLYVVYFLIYLVVQLAAGFSFENICLNKNSECYGSYHSNSKYEVQCERIKCFGKFSYQCGLAYCTTDKSTCLGVHSSGLFTEYMPSSYSNLLQMKKYKKVIDSIQQCPSLKQELNTEYVCVNQEFCIKKIAVSLRIRVAKMSKKTDCLCGGYFSWQCGKDFCTINKSACEAVQAKQINRSKAISIGIQQCQYFSKALK